MAAKKILRLTEEDKFDFDLIGIVCQHKDYRLCMAINRKIGLHLSKQDEYSVFNNKRMEDQVFSFYEYISDENDRYNLIANRSQKGFLLPEQKQIDYLFLMRLIRERMDVEQVIVALKEIPIILAAYALDPATLKSRENLVF
jgi:hypothetical protein